MKILILSLPRTGSSNLLTGLVNAIVGNPDDLTIGKFEPQNPKFWDVAPPLKVDLKNIALQTQELFTGIEKSETIVVKSILDHIDILCNNANIPLWDYLDEYIKLFDLVFFLKRKDVTPQIESFINCNLTGNWHGEYEYKSVSPDVYYKFKMHIAKYNHLLGDIISKYKDTYGPIYYEDIISPDRKGINKILERSGLKNIIHLDNLPLLYDKLDIKNKYRKG